MESWRKIEDYDYEVSDWGNVRRVGSATNLKPFQNRDGRFRIALSKNQVRKKYCVHRLVAIAFLENPENHPEVDHIDRNNQNNRLENLRWCSSSQNNCNKILQTKSGFPGVHKKNQKYRATIHINGKLTNLGQFETPEEAHEVWKKKKNEIAGVFSPFQESP